MMLQLIREDCEGVYSTALVQLMSVPVYSLSWLHSVRDSYKWSIGCNSCRNAVHC